MYELSYEYLFFFFSSRRRHTRFKCDWSSDVCSSDLVKRQSCDVDFMDESDIAALTLHWQGGEIMTMPVEWFEKAYELIRSEERRVGKECRSRWSPYH